MKRLWLLSAIALFGCGDNTSPLNADSECVAAQIVPDSIFLTDSLALYGVFPCRLAKDDNGDYWYRDDDGLWRKV